MYAVEVVPVEDVGLGEGVSRAEVEEQHVEDVLVAESE